MNFYILFLVLLSPLFATTHFPKNFIFGVANAPAQIEDELSDIWIDWANKGKISGWKNVLSPEKRLEFWTRPEIEINLAHALGVESFRMGIDWQRIMPTPNTFDEVAIGRYREIIQKIKAKNMKVMLTLMHHSVPKWVQDMGGWHNEKTIQAFVLFSQRMIQEYHSEVNWWITFNEGNVFVTMAYTMGIWPPGEKRSPLSLMALGPLKGESIEAMDRMAKAHHFIYDWAHLKFPDIKIGLAHNMAYYSGKTILDQLKASVASELMNWRFPEKIRGKMDFFGFNYYGAEWIKGTQVDIDPEEEYSEAGRAINVHGLYKILNEIHERFKGLPIIITENGIADATDIIRPSYHIEHLLAVKEAINKMIPVTGYYVWSLTDNLEWSDGYCPKFGLVSVDRTTFKRTPRASFKIFQEIVGNKSISMELREKSWKKVQVAQDQERPFCRASDGITAFAEPRSRKFVKKDWRFKLISK